MSSASVVASSAATVSPRIVVVGAGLGGLLFARALHVRSDGRLRCTVLEGEASAGARAQGGTLDMHEESGQTALVHAHLWGAIQPLLRPEGEAMTICGPDGVPLWLERDGMFLVGGPPASQQGPRPQPHEEGATPDVEAGAAAGPDGGPPLGGRPEVDRGALRKLLLDSLPEGCVRWGAKVASISAPRRDGSSARTILLSSGEQLEADLVVGADGAWSRVRPLLSSAMPVYSEITFVELVLREVDKLHPKQSEVVGPGTMMATAHDQGLIAQRLGDGSVRVYAALKVPPPKQQEEEPSNASASAAASDNANLDALDWTNPAAVRTYLLDRFAGWSPSLLSLVTECDDSPRPVARPLYGLPAEHTWPRDDSTRGLTLVGDAAHLMFPSGEGANLAMQDGAELALEIAATPHDVEGALARYEAAMWPRSAAEVKESVRMRTAMFAQDAPKSFVNLMLSFYERHADSAAEEQTSPAK